MLRAYLSFSNKYYVPIMYRFALKRALKSYHHHDGGNEPMDELMNKNNNGAQTCSSLNTFRNVEPTNIDNTSSSSRMKELMNKIQLEQNDIIHSEMTRKFLQDEKDMRNMTDKSWLPLVAQYIASNRVLAKELFQGDEKKAMLFIYDRALLPPVEKMMRMVLGGQGRKGIASGIIFRTPRAGEDDNQVDVLEFMWKIMSVANDLIHAWTLSHEIYHETKNVTALEGHSDSTHSGDDNEKIRISTIRVHNCMLNRFFKAHNASHLMPVICSFDTIWARNAYENTGHKLRRNQTLSLGGNYCAFDFSKGFEKEYDVVSVEIEKLRKH